MNGAFHRNSSVSWLFIERKDGGQGLISIEDCVRQEELGLNGYALEMEEGLLGMIASWLDYVRESKKMYKKRLDEARKEDLMGEALHGRFF